MPDFRVDSAYNLSAIEEEQAKFLAFLAQSKSAILDLNNQRVVVKSSDVSTFTQASENLNKSVASSNVALKNITSTSVEYNKQLALSAKATKDAAQAKLIEAKAILEQEKADAIRTKSLIAQEKELERLIALEEKKNAAVSAPVIDGGSRNSSQAIQATEAQIQAAERLRDAEAQAAMSATEYGNSVNKSTGGIRVATAADLELEKARKAVAKANSTQNVELQGLNAQRSLANKAAKEQALTNLGLIDSYTLLNKEYQAAAINAKNLAVQYGIDSVEAKAAAAEALALNTQIQAIDKTVGQSQKNVGNYGSAFTKGLSGAFNSLRKLAYLIPGIGIGGLLLLLIDPLKDLVLWFTKSSGAAADLERQTGELNDVMKESQSAFVKAEIDVQNLNNAFKEVKEGTISGDSALKLYNDTLGKSLGAVTSLDEAEQRTVKNGKAYIEMTLLKAASNIAMQKAAQAAFTAEEESRKDATTSFFDITDPITLKRERIKKAQQEEKDFKAISDGLLAKVKKIAKDNGISFDDIVPEGIIGKLKAKIDELQNIQPKLTSIDAIKKNVSEIKTLQDQLDALLGKEKKSKGIKDQSALLREYLKKDQDQISLYNEQELKSLIDKYKAEYENQENSENDRLASLQAYHDTEKALIEKQAQAKRDALKIQQTTDLDKAGDIRNLKLRNKTIAAITKEGIDELKNINSDAQRAQQQNDLQFSKDTIKIVDDGFKKNEQDLKDHISILKQLDEERLNSLLTKSNKSENEQATGLITDSQVDEAGKNAKEVVKIEADLQQKLTILEKQGQLERLEINNAELEADKAKWEAFAALAGEANSYELAQVEDIEAKITENKRKEAELRKGIITAEVNYEIQKRDELLDKVQQGESATLDVIQAFGDASFQRQADDAQKKENLLDEQTQREIELVNASVATEQEKADKIAIINARAAAEKALLDKQQRKADHDKAVFDKQIAVLQIIAQIAIDIAKGQFFTAALAGAALIKLIATPVPAYKHGRGFGKDEIAVVGDGGVNEYIMRGTGQIEKTPAVNTLTHLMPKDRVFPNKEALMKELIMSNMQLSDYSVGQDGGINRNDIKKMTSEIVGAVSDIRIQTQLVTKSGWRNHNERLAKYDAWVDRVIKN